MSLQYRPFDIDLVGEKKITFTVFLYIKVYTEAQYNVS